MSSDAQQHVVDALANPTVVKAVSTATATTGLATHLEWIPSNIGWIASCVGILATIVMVWLARRRDKRQQKAFELTTRESELRIKALEKEAKS